MKPFQPEISPGSPSLRIGERVPHDGVNIAYIASPRYRASEVKVIDLAARVAAVSEHEHRIEGAMYADTDGYLHDEEGRFVIPTDNVIATTSYVEDESGNHHPLYFEAISRFLHYEELPLIDENGAYKGNHVRIEDAFGPLKQPHEIRLLPTGTDHVWRVQVLCSVRNEVGNTHRLFYTRCDETGEIKNPSHREVLNPLPLFARRTRDNYDPSESMAFMTEPDDFSMGYRVKVPETATILDRSPLWIRWRATDGRTGRKSPWMSDALLRKDSLHPEDYLWRGKTVYKDEGDYAYKTLFLNLGRLFGIDPKTEGHIERNYSVEYEVWKEGEWKEDTDGWVDIKLTKDPSLSSQHIFADKSRVVLQAAIVGDRPTGAKGPASSLKAPQSTFEAFSLKVEGWEDRLAQAEKTIWHDVTRGGTVTASSNINQFGVTGSLAAIAQSTFAAYGSNVYSRRGYSAYKAQSAEMEHPPTSLVDITITLPSAKQIHSLYVDMGNTGTVNRLELERQGQATTVWQEGSLPSPEPIYVLDGGLFFPVAAGSRRYKEDLSSPVLAEKIHLRIRPSKWFTRETYDYAWAIIRLGRRNYRSLYRSGFEIFSVSAWEKEVIPAFYPWGAENTFYGAALYHAPYRIKLRSLLEQLKVLAPESAGTDKVYYRLTLTSGDPKVSLMLFRMDKGNTPYFNEGGEFVVPHSLIDQVMVEVKTEAHDMLSSPRYFLTNESPGQVFVSAPANEDTDALWTVSINRGITRVPDFENGIVRYYFPGEFFLQAFEPEAPYRRSENEVPIFLDRDRLQTAHFPLHVTTSSSGKPDNINVRVNGQDIEVADWVAETGEVILSRRVEFTDDLEIDYTYILNHLEYRGFLAEDDVFYHLDLNPLPGHTYTDLETQDEVPSSTLLEKDVYLYCLPFETGYLGQEVPLEPDAAPMSYVRHIIVDEGTPEQHVLEAIDAEETGALLLAKVLVRPVSTPDDVVLLDSRRRGGGAHESLSDAAVHRLAPDGDRFWDTGLWDGDPYPASGVLVITLPESTKEVVSEEEVKQFLEKTVAFGIYPLLRYRQD